MKPPLGLLLRFLLLIFVLDSHGGTVSWVGGSGDWNVPENWSSGALPTADDDVSITRREGIVVTLTGGQTVRSVQSDGSLIVAGSLTVTSGASIFTGEFRLAGGAQLQAIGTHTSAIASTATVIDGGSLRVSEGALISFPSVRKYGGGDPSPCGAYWSASGVGSIIDLPGLTNMTGFNCSIFGGLGITATDGGDISLPNVISANGKISIVADGAGSVVELSAFRGYVFEDGFFASFSLEARNEGTIRIPNLMDGTGVSVSLQSGGIIPTQQLNRLWGIYLDGMSATFPVITNLDGGSINVTGGGKLSLPKLRNYDRGLAVCGANWQATGVGSVIDLPGLTNIMGFHCSIFGGFGITAADGGSVLLTNVITAGGGRIGVAAHGTNSLVNLAAFTGYDFEDSFFAGLSLEAKDGGTIVVPKLIDGNGVTITLNPGGTIPTSQLERLWGVNLGGGIALTLPGVTNLDGGSLNVSGGSKLTIPKLPCYDRGLAVCGASWQAIDPGSVIDLPGLTNIAGLGCSILGGFGISASAGGQILLTNVSFAIGARVGVSAIGSGSLVDLSAFKGFDGTESFPLFSLSSESFGRICVPALIDGRSVSLSLRNGGFISVQQLRLLGPLSLENASLNLASVTNIDSADIYLSPGAVLSLPGVQHYDGINGCANRTWQVTGNGSLLDLSSITNLASEGCGTLNVQASTGGFVDLGSVLSTTHANISINVDGSDSLIDLARVSNDSITNFSIHTANGGLVDLPDLTTSIPEPPTLLKPTDNSSGTSLVVELFWQKAKTDVVGYEYEVLQNGKIVSAGPTSSGVKVQLPAQGKYQWHVRAISRHRQSDWSSLWTFDTLPIIGVPVVLAPGDTVASVPLSPTLEWSPVASAVAYDYELYYAGKLELSGNSKNTSVITKPLRENSIYSWRVRAKSIYRFGRWSELKMFQTVPIGASSLLLGIDLPAGESGVIRLNWPSVFGNTYWLQFKQTLEAPVWTDLPPMIASGRLLLSDQMMGTNVTGFLRVAQRGGIQAPSGFSDADHDQMDDAWELAHGLDPHNPADANADSDGDGLTNLDEFELGTDVNVQDLAGSIPGQFAVGSGGIATYEIPIPVPPSTAGMAPKLALSYSSRSGNGSLGMGWRISGLSAITRSPNAAPQSTVGFDTNDRYMLDGQSLIAVSGTNGLSGAEYRTEIDTFTKIISYGQSGVGPAYFQAWSKGGQILEFGLSEDSHIEAQGKPTIMCWLLGKITDTKGNYVRFYYTKNSESGEYMPSRIEYTGNDAANVAPYAGVLFNYEPRPDGSISYKAGSIIQNNYRLKNIETYAEGDLVNRFSLSYGQGIATGRSRLQSITLSDADGRSLPSTVCTDWTDTEQRGSFAVLPAFTPGAYPTSTNGAFFEVGDFNGDGVADLVHFVDASGVRLWVSKADGTFDVKPSFPNNGYPVDANGYRFISGDFNGDGKADLLHFIDPTHLRVWLSSGDGTFDIRPTFPNGGYDLSANNYNFRTGDFNGDGRTDLMHLIDGNTIRIWLSNGDGTFYVPEPWQTDEEMSSNGYKVMVADVNGDGRADVIHFVNNRYLRTWISQGDGTFRSTSRFPAEDVYDLSANDYSFSSGDFNGDGKTDLIHFMSENSVRIWLNKGDGTFDLKEEFKPSGFVAASQFFSHNGAHSDRVQFVGRKTSASFPNGTNFCSSCVSHPFLLGDFNGDGKSDFVDVAGPNQVTMWTSQGDGSFKIESPFSQTNYDVGNLPASFVVGNFGSDSKTDLIQIVGNYSAHLWKSPGPLPDLLSTVANGFGYTNHVIYEPITFSASYQKDTNIVYPQSDLRGPLYVVTTHETGDGLGGLAATHYFYGGAKSDATNGYLGFRWEKAVEERTGTASYTEFRQDYPFIGSVSYTDSRLADGTLLTRSTNSYADFQSFSNLVHYPYTSQSVVEGFELDGNLISRILTTNQFDAFGNPMVIDVTANDGFRRFTENTYSNDTDRWILGKITQGKVTAYAPDQAPQTRTSSFEYNPADGLRSREIIEPGSPLTQVTDYIRDMFGNCTVATVSGPGVEPRNVKTTFDSTGRFPLLVENALGHREMRSFDPRFGAEIERTDPNNLTTRQRIDGFGRLREIDRPDGVVARILYALPDSHAPPSARHRVLTKVLGSVPSAKYFDELGRDVRHLSFGFDGRAIYQDTVYEQHGWTEKTSRPYFAGEAIYWTKESYDPIGRSITETNPDNSELRKEYHGLTTVTINELRQKRTTVRNSQDWLVSAIDDSENSVTYLYDPFGNLIQTKDAKNNVIRAEFDIRGRKITMSDPDAGPSSIRYNAFSEMVGRTDAKNQSYSTGFDRLGRVIRETLPEGAITYEYDTAPNGIGKIASVTSYNGYRRQHSYDGLSRPDTTIVTYQGESFGVRSMYDGLGRVEYLQYPTGFLVRQVYNAQGYLAEIRKATDNSLLWRADAMSAEGQMLRQLLGNGVTTTREYNPMRGWVQGIRSGRGGVGNIQNLSFSFDFVGNLNSRADDALGLRESFLYDNLNRLTQAQIGGRDAKTYHYDSLGNIIFKSDVGLYSYDGVGAGPHAVTKAGAMTDRYSYDPNGNMLGGNGRTFSYFSFNKPQSIANATARSDFAYDAEHNRLAHISVIGGVTTSTLFIGSLYERITSASGARHKHYVNAGNSLIAICSGDDSAVAARTHYVHKDHLGSIESLTDEVGQVVERFAYDPHGKRRGPLWEDQPSGSIGSTVTARGFGGHIQLDALEIVHMGGRVYDPVLGRFTSPDSFVQSMENSQALNRYSYALNNPLSFTDPTGFFFKGLQRAFHRLVNAIQHNARTIIGIAVAAAIGDPFLGGFFSGLITSHGNLKSAIISAITAVAFNVTGIVLQNAGPIVQTAAHGVVGGLSAEVQGGNFFQGFASAAAAKSFSGEIEANIQGDGIADLAGRVIASATLGGIASNLTGGTFSQGAITASFSRLFNDEHALLAKHGVLNLSSFYEAVAADATAVGSAVETVALRGLGALSLVLSIPGDAQVPQYLYHFTSAYGQIIQSGALIPSPQTGKLFLTPDTYQNRAVAQDKLSLERQPTGFFSIPIDQVGPYPTPTRVGPDEFHHNGGGLETWVDHKIPVDPSMWTPIP